MDLLQFCNFMVWRSTLISFQAWSALDFMLLVPYNIVFVRKLTNWFSLSFLVFPDVWTKVIRSSNNGGGRFLLILSWANKQIQIQIIIHKADPIQEYSYKYE